MENNHEQERSPFIDFASFQNVQVTKRTSKGSVLKADTFDLRDARKIEVEANDPGQPGIILHRLQLSASRKRHTILHLAL